MQLLNRRCSIVSKAEAGKGFGKVKPQPKAKKKGNVAVVDNNQAVDQALKLTGSSKSSPVDPKEAARGKIDYAKVKNWGADGQKDPGSLQLESFNLGRGEDKKKLSFYTRLCMHLLQIKASGELDDELYNKLPVTPRSDIPEQETWKYSKARYVQYLVDLQAVHHAAESGLAEAIAAQPETSKIRAALDCYSEQRGLDRSLEIATDLTNLDHSSENSSHPGPSLHILAQTKRISELMQFKDKDEGALRLLAHVFALHLYHFTGGSKLGAEIAQKLNLFKLNAVHLFRSYPQSEDYPDKDPFKAFQALSHGCGEFLNEEQIQIVEAELQTAMAYSSMLVQSVAYSD